VDGDPTRAWTVLRRDGSLHPSPNAGRLEAAFAGALGVGLGGVNTYDGRIEARPRMGDDAGREPEPADLRRAVRLSRAIGWASTLVCAALALALAGALAKVRRKSVAPGTKSSSPRRPTRR
jgi:adenosylcobinamide-phosphate synthase